MATIPVGQAISDNFAALVKGLDDVLTDLEAAMPPVARVPQPERQEIADVLSGVSRKIGDLGEVNLKNLFQALESQARAVNALKTFLEIYRRALEALNAISDIAELKAKLILRDQELDKVLSLHLSDLAMSNEPTVPIN